MMRHTSFKTIDLARTVGLSTQQVRNYEAWGFLPPVERSTNGYRLYASQHLEALKAARCMIRGYGWQHALAIMQAVHRKDLQGALALVDMRHAEIDRQRTRVAHTLNALASTMSPPVNWARVRQSRGLQVGEAAKRVGVQVSALHFWEQQGLLSPIRESGSRYRLYDEQQMHRLQVVALLREAGYRLDAIRAIMDEMVSGQPEHIMEAMERRRKDLTRASCACTEATATLWSYIGNAYPEILDALLATEISPPESFSR